MNDLVNYLLNHENPVVMIGGSLVALAAAGILLWCVFLGVGAMLTPLTMVPS